MIRAAILLTMMTGSSAAAGLDYFASTDCAVVDQLFAKNGPAIVAYNAASRDAVTNLKNGDQEKGCTGLRSVLTFTGRAAQALNACSAANRDDGALAVGFADLHGQVAKIGRREGCLGKPAPGS